MKVALGMFILLSKSENGGTCFTLVHCAQTKNILANEPSPQRCSMVQVSRKSVILSFLEVLWHTKIDLYKSNNQLRSTHRIGNEFKTFNSGLPQPPLMWGCLRQSGGAHTP